MNTATDQHIEIIPPELAVKAMRDSGYRIAFDTPMPDAKYCWVATGHPATVITTLGEVARTETEVVEFIEGRGSTGCPVTTIASTSWQHVDLGSVTANGCDLVADTPGYSLLNLTYITTSLDWQVHLDHEEEVQFVLVDA